MDGVHYYAQPLSKQVESRFEEEDALASVLSGDEVFPG